MFRLYVVALYALIFCSTGKVSNAKGPVDIVGGFDGANPQSQDSIIQETLHRQHLARNTLCSRHE